MVAVDTESTSVPGFRPVKLTPTTTEPLKTTAASTPSLVLSPTISGSTTPDIDEVLLGEQTDKSFAQSTQPSSIHKYWTLPRHVATGSKLQYEDLPQRIVTDQSPPPDANFLYETPTAKYYTLPTKSLEKQTKVVQRAPSKPEGIGPLNEAGIPITTKQVSCPVLFSIES